MATKPTVLPKWAEDDQVDPVSGESNVYEPPENRKLSGWNRREIPPRQWFNWLGRLTYRWILWAKEELENLSGRGFFRTIRVAAGDDLLSLPVPFADTTTVWYDYINASQPSNVPEAGAAMIKRLFFSSQDESLIVYMRQNSNIYYATKSAGVWGPWEEILANENGTPTLTAGDGLNGGGLLDQDRSVSVDSTVVRTTRQINTGRGLVGGGDLSANRTLNTYRFSASLDAGASTISSNFDGVYSFSSATGGHTIQIANQTVDEGATETVLICRETSSFKLFIQSAGPTIVWSFDESISAVGYELSPGEIVRLVKVATNSYVAYADNGISETIELDGDFSSGQFITCQRSGKELSFVITGAGAGGGIEHPSNSEPTSAPGGGLVPALYQPEVSAELIYYSAGTIVLTCEITSSGLLRFKYKDWSGSPVARTDSFRSVRLAFPK